MDEQDEFKDRSAMAERRETNEYVFTDEEVRALARRAVDRLAADAKSGRLDENRELAEVIEGCIRNTKINIIRDLHWLLRQQDLERPD